MNTMNTIADMVEQVLEGALASVRGDKRAPSLIKVRLEFGESGFPILISGKGRKKSRAKKARSK